MSTAVVTGASGHLGANLVRALMDRGQSVRTLIHRNDRVLEGLDVERVQGDLLDASSLERAFAGADEVYHLAAFISILGQRDRLEAINVQGTANVVEACLRSGVRRLVHTSSIEALLHPGVTRPVDERDPPEPDAVENAYGRSKAWGVRKVIEGVERGLDAVIVNPTAIVGPYDSAPSLFGQMFIDYVRRKLPALVEGGFDLVDARDVAAGQIAAAEQGRRGERYLLSGHFMTLKEIGDILTQETGARPPRMVLPVWLASSAAHFTPPFYWLTRKKARFTPMSVFLVKGRYTVSHDKASRELGYQPRHPTASIRDALAWYREQGMLNGD
ncbi:MAG: SDR family oxidoreductase [Deltaproteobacteria bacterium]|nr:SDR family oxidoreductase [Deltaproteobacteria bacterium]